MTSPAWHAPAPLLAAFVDDPGAVDDATAASIEAHLVGCDDCRQALTAAADPSLAATSWASLADQIDRPRATPVERLLHRLGIDGGVERLLGATPALQASGLLAIALLAGMATAVSRIADDEGPFLVLAPLALLAAVAASFAPVADPAGEAGVATALHGVGLVVRRAIAVLVVTFALLGVAALALPDIGLEAAAWVLPSLALALGALALGTWVRLEVAVGALAAGWMLVVWWVWWSGDRHLALEHSTVFTGTGQAAFLALALVAAAALGARRDHFATLEAFR